MKKFLTFSASYAALALSTLAAAQAQSIDYSTMEELFQEPVTTSANGSPQRTSDVALNMEILTAKEIERTGARSIPEALRHLPGLDVRQMTLGQHEVGIRGYNQGMSERILVLLNGRQVYSDFFGQVIWDSIPVEMGEIKQIEVVKGPNTALFGFNAVSGVINIITYNPLYDDKKSATVTAGNKGLKGLSGSVTQKITDKIAVRVSAGGDERDKEFSDIRELRTQNGSNSLAQANLDETNRSSLLVDTWMQVTDQVQTQIELSKTNNQRNERLVTGIGAGSEYQTQTARGRIIADTAAGLIEAEVFHTTFDANMHLNLASGAAIASLDVDNHLTVAKLSDTFQVGKDHTFRIAGEYREATNYVGAKTAFGFSEINGDDLRYEIWSGSALWDWKVTDKLRTSTAVRFDSFDLSPDGPFASGAAGTSAVNPYSDSDYNQTREEYSYNLGVAYQIDDARTLRATAARGADLPSFVEFGFQNRTGASTGLFGDPNVETSIVTNYEIGYDHKIPEINGIFRSAVFYQQSDEMQAVNAIILSSGNQFSNAGDSELFGIELGVDGLYQDRWDWGVNYTFIDINDDLRNNQSSADLSSPTNYEDSAISHTLNLKLGYLGDGWRTNGLLQYRSSFDEAVYSGAGTGSTSLDLVEVDDQVSLSANVAIDLSEGVTWNISGTNLLGGTDESAFAETEAQVWSSIKVNF